MCFNVCFSWNWNRYRTVSELCLRKGVFVVSIFFVPIVVIFELVVILVFFAVPFCFFGVSEDTSVSESASAVTEEFAIWGMPEITSFAFLAKPDRVKSAGWSMVVAAW